MTSLYHQWGEDLQIDSKGGLRIADATKQTEQRLIRRYMTNPGDMQDSGQYGAGIRQFIGQNTDVAKIKATMVQQTRMERSVSRSPSPSVTVRAINQQTVIADVTYTDATTGAFPALQMKISA
ncbi:hypothetical protein BKE38_08750 [Pseudoroseomonas deserti]|uniref:Phage tail protein n=1 Tax=Teichococcus deserti TaxID=1817963 RepID=A0A1V2H4M2_9PROT|nr:hypothetical protein [Pseudoroseomonas deserti]ONG55746.1 hypothetical protein BKE38_08750 [Pseudoroseomonas deserti]